MKLCTTILFSLFILIACNSTKDFQTLFDDAQQLTVDSNFTASIELLDDVIALNPEFDSAYAERAYCYYRLQEYDQALKDADKATDLAPNNYDARYVRGLICMETGDYEIAYNEFGKAKYSRDSNYWYDATINRAIAAFYMFDDDAAFSDINELLKRYPNDYEGLIWRGKFKAEQDIYPVYKDSLDAMKSDSVRYYADYQYYFIYNSFDDQSQTVMLNTKGALEDFTAAIKSNPEKDQAYFERASVYENLFMDFLALIDIDKAISINPSPAEYHALRSHANLNLGQYKEAINDLSMAIELNPEDGTNYLNRGYIYETLKDFEAAENDFEMAEKLGVTKG